MIDEINNSAVIKIIANHTKELSDLNAKYIKLGKELLFCRRQYAEVLDEKTTTDAKNYELRKLLKEAQRECRVLQESLDHCQRDLEEVLDK